MTVKQDVEMHLRREARWVTRADNKPTFKQIRTLAGLLCKKFKPKTDDDVDAIKHWIPNAPLDKQLCSDLIGELLK